MSTRGILITLATIFLQTPWLVSARWEDRPILGLFCFDFLPAWVCVKDRAKYFIESNCDASADTSQLEVVLDFYFKAGQESNQGSLYEQGWFSDCNFCSWDGITCDGGNITGLDMNATTPPLTGTLPTEIALLVGLTNLDLQDNNLEGEVPTELGLLTNLNELLLHGNSLTGDMPKEVCALGPPNGRQIFISADCARPRPEIKCRYNFCCDACYSDALRAGY